MSSKKHPKSTEADICLILEGSYPYISGGVSSWVAQMLKSFSHLRFAIVYIGSSKNDYDKMKFELPDNVVHFQEHYLLDEEAHEDLKPKETKLSKKQYKNVAKLHDWFHEKETNRSDILESVLRYYEKGPNEITFEQFLYSDGAWDFNCKAFNQYCTDPSFIDYFWTIRNMHAPMWLIGEIIKEFPNVKVLHTISTGYAGYFGALLKYHFKIPLILSEHGIYTKERRIDLVKGQWVHDNRSIFLKDTSSSGYYKELWIRFFESLAKICYQASDDIISLYGGVQPLQVQGGADPKKMSIIANGVNVESLRPLRDLRDDKQENIICLLGRVVPIKDIKTLIRSMPIVIKSVPDAKIWIVGPQEEDKKYNTECITMVRELNLSDHITFMGKKNIKDVLYKVRIMVLSSISEGLPLSILEGFAAGVPAVTTNVGACVELINGLNDEDKALGKSGRIVEIANPVGLANAIIELLQDKNEWSRSQKTAIERVEKNYGLPLMIEKYNAIYQKAMK